MVATLRAVKPEIISEGKPKFLISGKSGFGKTWFALDFPAPYYFDTEGGAIRKQYKEKLIANGGMYFGKEQGSQDFKAVIDEIKALATTKHAYKTLVIDSFSQLYNLAAAIAEEKVGNDYGKDKKEANRPTRQLMRWIENLDMTVILICHHKDKWERKAGQVVYAGSTFDGFEKMEYNLDLWIEVQKVGKDRTFIVRKSRISTFEEGDELPLDYKLFSDLYGKDIIEKAASPVEMATPEQVTEIKGLLEVVKVDDELKEKWFNRANVDKWEEMTSDQLQGCINVLKKKLAELNKGGK